MNHVYSMAHAHNIGLAPFAFVGARGRRAVPVSKENPEAKKMAIEE
jgi:hypothetical protein